jgi:hypothetical protein
MWLPAIPPIAKADARPHCEFPQRVVEDLYFADSVKMLLRSDDKT